MRRGGASVAARLGASGSAAGSQPTAWASCRSSCSGGSPRKALRLARDTGVLVALLPEFERAIGFDQESRYHDLTVDEHTFAVVQAAADAGMPLRVRLATLFHDLGKPHVAWRGRDGRLHFYARPGNRDHADVGAELADGALRRLRYPTELRERVVRIVRFHMFNVGQARHARTRGGCSRATARGSRSTCSTTRRPTCSARAASGRVTRTSSSACAAFARSSSRSAEPAPPADLAVDGTDLIELGYRPGPELGRTLEALLEAVVDDPALNRRETLLDRARRQLLPRDPLGGAGPVRRRVHDACSAV